VERILFCLPSFSPSFFLSVDTQIESFPGVKEFAGKSLRVECIQ
jgi:hypothetical protein